MEEYSYEFEELNFNKLKFTKIDEELLKSAHASLPLIYHDVYIWYKENLLLIKPTQNQSKINYPTEGIMPIGGLIKKGMPIKQSIKKMVMDELGIELDDINELGWARVFSEYDPFNHGKGTDCIRITHIARANGILKSNSKYEIITYNLKNNSSFQLPKYVTHFINLAIKSLNNEKSKFMIEEFLLDNVNLDKLKSDFIENELYKNIHAQLVIACHDAIIEFDDSLLFVKRSNRPLKNAKLPVGGRIERGVRMSESMISKAAKECGLNLENIIFIGDIRTIFGTDPFNHGCGTDTINLVCYANGKGEVVLDKDHASSVLISLEELKNLHIYTQRYIPLVKQFIKITKKI